MSKIHNTAIIHPSAQIADDVEIGAFAVIGEKGKILGSIIEIFLRKHSVVDEDFQVIPLFLKLFTVILEDRLQTV